MSVYDRLTNTNSYTGQYKNMFDENGHGRGKAGRNTGVDGISDLSQITRPEMHKGSTLMDGSRSSQTKPSPRTGASTTTHTTTRTTKKSSGPSIYDRLTDTSTYTGAHKYKFDENGHGLGKAGRDTGIDGISDLSQITRPEMRVGQTGLDSYQKSLQSINPDVGKTESAPKPRAAKKSSGPSIYDRLCDSSGYTGQYKHMFDENGQGRGKAGRDTKVDGISDLSQITRPEMHVGPTGLDSYRRSQEDYMKPATGAQPVKSSPRKTASKGPSIYDRLTDTSTYTGAHKYKFDADGHGLGRAGRDTGIDGIKDLSQITRPDLK